MLKKIFKIFRNTLIVLIILLIGIFFAIQLPSVQTWLTHRVASYLSHELGAKVEVGSVEIDIWARLVIKDLYVEDQKQDTLAFVKELAVRNYSYDRLTGHLSVNEAELTDPYFNLIRHQGDSLLNYKFILDYLESSDTTQKDNFIEVNHIKLNNGRFNYINENKPIRDTYGIDWNNLVLHDLNLEMDNLSLIGDSVHTKIDHLSMKEKTGFEIRDMTNELYVVNGDTRIEEAHIVTGNSELNGSLKFKFESIDDIDFFEEKVKMNHQFVNTKIQMSDLAYFSSDLKGYDKLIEISGQVKGTVSNLKGRDIFIALDKNTSFKGNFEMEGLPDIDQTFITMDIKSLTSNKMELDKIQIPPYDSLHYLKTPENFSQLGQINYTGNFTGFINDFVSYGTFTTAIGKVRTDLSLKEDPSINDYRYNGGLALNNFDLGKFYQSSTLGPISCDLNVQGKGLELKKVDATFKGDIPSLRLNDYDYTNIKADGTFKHKSFDGDFTINDPNVIMDFTGNIDFTKTNPILSFDAQVFHLNLKAVNVLTRYDYSSVSGNVSVKSEGFEIDKFVGEVVLDNITYCALDKEYAIDHLELFSERIGESSITLDSDIASATITGEFNVKEVGSSLIEIASKIIPSFQPPIRTHRTQNFKMDLKIYDFTQVSEIFLPDLYLAPNTEIKLEINEPGSFFETIIISDKVKFGDNEINALALDIRRPDESFYITIASDKFKIGSDITFDEIALDARTDKDTVYTAISWGDESFEHRGDINGKLTVRDYNKYDFTFNESSVVIREEPWKFKSQSALSMDSANFSIHNFEIYNGSQRLIANGKITNDPLEILTLQMQDFELSSLNPFLGESTKFYGKVNGTATIRDIYHDLISVNNFALTDFKLNEYKIGDLNVASSWDQSRHQLRIDGNLQKSAESGNPLIRYTPLSFAGYYRPQDKISPLDLTATIKDLDLSFINAFLSPGIIDIQGFASGTMSITGKPEAPLMQAEALLRDASIFVYYLNTKYFIEDHIGVYPDMYTFDHIPIRDQENNKGYLTGQMLHNNFADWNFDLVIDMDQPMLTLNTSEDLNSMYYGKAYTTGTVNIYGYQDNLEFDIDLKSEKGTTLAMPMGNSSDQTFENFIRFVNADDTIKAPPLNLSGIKMKLQMEITPEAEFQIIFDESVGDIMRGSGKGHISMEINNLSSFNMYGLVELVRGDYLFTLKNLINKEFVIKPGGTVSWFGDPFAGELDIQAIYKVSASLYDLMPNDPAYQGGQRVPINLGMKLRGKMLNPAIDFNIELPSVDQVTRSRVDAIISNEQERNRQAFALLVLRRFVSPPNVTTDHNNASALTANGTEFLSSQISNWLSQISNDFNLGFNYSPGDDISNEEIALALSTQLFNERLSLSSNVGVSRNTSATSNSQNTTNLIGDIRIEYKITTDGKIRLVVYNESTDFRMAYTQQTPYTQGIGVIYRQDFDTMEEFLDGFKQLLKGNKKSPS